MNNQATYVVQLTPNGRGAIAVVVVDGPKAVSLVDTHFAAANGNHLQTQPIGRIILGRWGGSQDRPGEELVLCRRATDRVEVHPHGGGAAVQAVLDDLVEAGGVIRDWNESITADENDPIRAAARVALAGALTERTAAILLDQYHGALRRAIDEIHEANALGTPESTAELDKLLARAELGRRLTRPWRVVIAGPPNVGKSSLVNAILGYDRAIVFDEPGTTRDVVTATTAIDGWPVEFSDTAGLRQGGDAVESAGVALAELQLEDADLVVWVDDATRLDTKGVSQKHKGEPPKRSLQVVNKIDRLGNAERLLIEGPSVSNMLFTSATTGEGLPALLVSITDALVPNPPPPGSAVPFAEEQLDMLQSMRVCTDRAYCLSQKGVLQGF